MPCLPPRLPPYLLSVLLVLGGAAEPRAQGRVATRTLTCAALKALVDRERDVVLASSDLVYETVHRDSGVCRQDETGLPAFEPTLDAPSCFAGWRCHQRANDPGQK